MFGGAILAHRERPRGWTEPRGEKKLSCFTFTFTVYCVFNLSLIDAAVFAYFVCMILLYRAPWTEMAQAHTNPQCNSSGIMHQIVSNLNHTVMDGEMLSQLEGWLLPTLQQVVQCVPPLAKRHALAHGN